jgi:hypothetical protein
MIQFLPTDLFLLNVVPNLSILDKISLYDTCKYFRSLFPNLYKTIFNNTVNDLTTWATTPLNSYNSKEEIYEIYEKITLSIRLIRPSLIPSLNAFFYIIYNMHYFNLMLLNNVPYRLQQHVIIGSPFAAEFIKIAITLYIQKFKDYPQMIENEEITYAPIVYMNRTIPDEIKLRTIAASYIDLISIPDYTKISTAMAHALVQKVIQARHPNYMYRHSYNSQNEKFQILLQTIPSTTTDPFLSIIKTL